MKWRWDGHIARYPGLETEEDKKKHEKISKKLSGRHKDSGGHTVDELAKNKGRLK